MRLKEPTNAASILTQELLKLYERSTDHGLLVRRIHLSAGSLIGEEEYRPKAYEQMDLFTDYEAAEKEREAKRAALEKERKAREAVIEIHRRFGRNAALKASSLEEGSTAKERNLQIGGHKA